MKKVIFYNVELEIADFFDAQAVQALFDSLKRPENKSSSVFNLMKIAEYLELNNEVAILDHLLSLIDMNMSSKAVNIGDELYAICKKIRGYVFQVSHELLGKKLTNYLYNAVQI